MRTVLLQLGFVRIGGHLFAGVLTVLLLFPFLDRPSRERRLVRWAGRMLSSVGVRVVSRGQMPESHGDGALLVANHVSWLDIHVIHSLLPARFISKAEVRDWPVIGWLADRAGGTLFLERARKSDAKRVNEVMAGHLRDGDCLALFPEGTTSDGSGLLPFYPSLFQPAVDAEATIWPVRIRYLDEDGRHTTEAAYYGEMTMLESFRKVVAARRLVAEIEFLPTISARGLNRRELAQQAEAVIRATWAGGAPGSRPGSDDRLPA